MKTIELVSITGETITVALDWAMRLRSLGALSEENSRRVAATIGLVKA